jgi:hypothetical protein
MPLLLRGRVSDQTSATEAPKDEAQFAVNIAKLPDLVRP